MLKMTPKETQRWAEIRKQGSNRYSLITSFIATNVAFLLHFIISGYQHIEEIDKYLAYNSGRVYTIMLMLAITFVALFIGSKALFILNEKRYRQTIDKK